MILDALTREDVQKVREWRNADLTPWRTPYLLTAGMQEDFYRKYVDNRNSPHRYWAIKKETETVCMSSLPGGGHSYDDRTLIELIGMGGLTDISPENRSAEITLTIDPDLAGKGYGEEAVELIYKMAFGYLNLDNVYGEVYWCNERGVNFWTKIIVKYNGQETRLFNRKYWNGQYYDSTYFNIARGDFNGTMRKMRDTDDTPDNDVGTSAPSPYRVPSVPQPRKTETY